MEVVKRSERSDLVFGYDVGFKKTVFHVLMVSNATAAWRRFAVCVRSYEEFRWLSSHLYDPKL